MSAIDDAVKQILKQNPEYARTAKKVQGGFAFEASATGNAYNDFREEYEDADIIDDRVARRAFGDRTRTEQYYVVISSRQPGKARVVEVHNKRFAEYKKGMLAVKDKEDVVAELMNRHGIKPQCPGRPKPGITIQPMPVALYGITPPTDMVIKYGIIWPLPPKPPTKPVIRYGMIMPYPETQAGRE